MARPQPKCPIRAGERCSQCVPGATGPDNCGLVWLVKSDPELAEELLTARLELQEQVAEQERLAQQGVR